MSVRRHVTVSTNLTGALDEAEICSRLADYYGWPSRVTIGIVIRNYLDSVVLTPFEILHNHKLLRGLLEQTTLVENAMIRVATVQARTPGHDAKSRKAALQNAINEIASKAWSAQGPFAAIPRGRNPIEWLQEQPGGQSPSGDPAYDLSMALALDLVEHRTWPAKVDRIIALLKADGISGQLMPLLDSALADALGSGLALQEVLNMPAATAGELLVGQCRLVLGVTTTVAMTGPNRDSILNGMFRQGRLPQSRASVLERVRRQLRSPSPLGRGTVAQDNETLRAAMGYLLAPSGVVGGAPMAEAVTLRYSRRLEQGGAAAFRRSIIGVAEMQADLFARINYLTAISQTTPAERHLGEIVETAEAALNNELLIEAALLQYGDIDSLRTNVRSAADAIREASLPEETRVKLAGRAMTAIDSYVQSGRLSLKLKQAEPHLRRRAIRMLELACSGLLVENSGLPVLRQSITDIVRQPEFQNDIKGPQQSEAAQLEVRRLYELLDLMRQGGVSTAVAPRPAPSPSASPAPSPMAALAPVQILPAPPLPRPNVLPMAAAEAAGASPAGRALGGRALGGKAAAGGRVRSYVDPRTDAAPTISRDSDSPPRTRVGRVPAAAPAAAPPAPAPVAPPLAAPLAAVAALLAESAHCPNCLAAKPPHDACPECGFPKGFETPSGIHLLPGTLLMSRYGVGKLLGQGGFGATYLGWDDRLQVKVAVKEYYPANLISRVPGTSRVIPFSDIHAEGFQIGLRKFLEEARLLARLRDIKEIVGVQDFFEENGTAYLIMELLQGRTFKKYVSENGGTIDVRRAVSILSPIMKALQSVHDQGLIHRDVAPDNIFITAAGERKLLDFGAARHAAGQAANLTVILKPGYAPPEQYSQEGMQGPWTDVYAMCATIYMVVCGKTPPDATSRFMTDRVPRLADYGIQAPPGFEKALLAGLAMRHTDRPQSMRELQKALVASLG